MSVDLDDDDMPFTVWPMGGLEMDARPYRAATAKQAAERCARDDYSRDPSWQSDHRVYYVLDGSTGRRWTVTISVVQQPSFVAVGAREQPMTASTHVMWHGRVICEDLRLRGVPASWPVGQRWISLKDVVDGAAAPPDRCPICWDKAPTVAEELRLRIRALVEGQS